MAKSKYEIFLSKIDDLSKIRLERIDMIFQVNRYKFMSEGFELDEVSCVRDKSVLYRNNNGYFPYEEKALNTKEDYDAYQEAVNFYKKHKDEFKTVHGLLQEKEMILNGYYRSNEEVSELNNLVSELGYGEARARLLSKYDGAHPSEEFKKLTGYLNELKKADDVPTISDIVDEAFASVEKAVNDGFRIELKKMRKKYDTDFDNYVGVVIIDQDTGSMNLLYGSDGFEVSQNITSKMVNLDFPYLEVYLKIITMGLLKSTNC